MSVDTMPLKRRRSGFWFLIAAAACAGIVALLIPQPPPTAYRFITADHPISVELDRNGRWFYYMADGRGTVTQVANGVREELLPLGFREDFSSKPWFRFVKGSREVIVCNHDE